MRKVHLKGLDNSAKYKDIITGEVYGGDFLQNAGLVIKKHRDFESNLSILKKI